LDEKTNKRLEALAARTGRTKTYYVRAAVLAQIEDLEDLYEAERAFLELRSGRDQAYSLSDVKRRLGLAD
jgi:RHH-type rel operon transcriptional repressor/antitoxin RelB